MTALDKNANPTPMKEIIETKVVKRKKNEMRGTRFYKIWENIKARCGKRKDYINVFLCDRWKIFDNFKEDMYPSYLEHMGTYGEKQTTIDRIDVYGNYEPSNCRWATFKVQSRNRKGSVSYNGENAHDASMRLTNGRNSNLVYSRINFCDWSIEDAFTKPLQHVSRKAPDPKTINKLEDLPEHCVKIVKVLADQTDTWGEVCFYMRHIEEDTKLTRKEIVKACRTLRQLGYIEYIRGLMDEDGKVAGSGYCITSLGKALVFPCQNCKEEAHYAWHENEKGEMVFLDTENATYFQLCEEHYQKNKKASSH